MNRSPFALTLAALSLAAALPAAAQGAPKLREREATRP